MCFVFCLFILIAIFHAFLVGDDPWLFLGRMSRD